MDVLPDPDEDLFLDADVVHFLQDLLDGFLGVLVQSPDVVGVLSRLVRQLYGPVTIMPQSVLTDLH